MGKKPWLWSGTIEVMAAMEQELAGIGRDPIGHGISFPNNRGHAFVSVTGVGKVQAALAAVAARQFHNASTLILVGTSGATDPTLEIGDVVIARDTLFHDVDVTTLGFAPGEIPYVNSWIWQSDPLLRECALEAAHNVGCRAHLGRIVSGDRFVSDPQEVVRIYETFSASAIDMETAAVAQVCAHSTWTPERWISIRVISDRADKSAPVDFPTFLPQAAKTIGKIARELVRILG